MRGIFQKEKGGDWWIRYVDAQGKYRREVAGSFGTAKKLLTMRRHEALEKKKLPTNLRRGTILFDKLCDAAKTYIQTKYADPQHDLGRLETVRGWFAGRDATTITANEIETRLNQEKDERKWSASSYNHHRTVISLCFRLGMRADLVSANPVRGGGVVHEKEDNSRVRWLSADEEARLRAVIRSDPAWAPHEPELTLAVATGLRRKSMYLHLVWKEEGMEEGIDLIARTATIPETKNGDPLTIPLNDDAIKALMVFRGRGGAGRVVRNESGEALAYPSHWFTPAVRKAAIKNFKWHDCRHTFASRLVQKGVPINEVSKLLGHKSIAMTMRYAHLAPGQLRLAVNKIATNSTRVAPDANAEKEQVARVQ